MYSAGIQAMPFTAKSMASSIVGYVKAHLGRIAALLRVLYEMLLKTIIGSSLSSI